MATSNPYIGIDMGVDITALRTGLNDAKSAIQQADADFKNNTAGLGKWSSSAEGLAEKLAAMATEVQAKQQIMEAYRAELDRVTAAYGKDSTAAKKVRTQLTNAEADYKNAQAYTADLEQKLQDMASAEALAKKDGTSLASSVKRLTSRVQAQREAVDETNAELDEAKRLYGADSKQAQALTSKLKTQQKQLGYVEDTLGKYERALESSNKDSKNATSYAGKFTTALGKMKKACSSAIKGGLNKLKEKLTDLGKNALGGIANAVTDFAKQTVQLGMDFGETMQKVKATAQASDEEMETLEATAREFGATTTFSAIESAEALNYMALAGWDVQQSVDGLPGVLSLAAASGMELADASDMITDYLTAFGLKASDSAHFADVLAFAQSHANTTAEGLGEAYKNSAASMKGAGQSMETATAALAIMSNAGLKGSEAGTALNAVMRDMTRRMKDGSIMIGNTSVQVADEAGNFRNLINILADVEKATKGLGTAEAQSALMKTFTSDSIKGLNLMLGEGSGAIRDFYRQLKSADGTAQDMSDTMNDSLAGDMKSLNSALQDVQLRIYDCLEGPLRGIVQFITDAIPVLIKFAEEVYNFFVKVYDATKPIWDALGEFFGWLGPALGEAGTAIGNAFNTISETLGKIGAWFENLGKDIIGFIKDPWGSIKGFFEGKYNEIKEAFKDPETSFKTIGNTAKNALEQTFNATPNNFKGKYENILKVFDKAGIDFGKIGADMKGSLEGAWNGITSWAGGVFNDIKGVFTNPKDTLQAAGGKMWQSLKDGWTNITGWAGGVFSSIKGVFDSPANTLQAVGGKLWQSLKDGWANISGWASNVLGTINSALGDPAGTISSTGTKLWNSLKGAFTNVQTWFTNNVYNPMTNAFSGVQTWASNTFGGVWGAISNAFSGVSTFFGNIFNGIVKAIAPVLQFFGISVGDGFDPLADMKQKVKGAEAEVARLYTIYQEANTAKLTARSRYGYGTTQEAEARRASNAAYTAWDTARKELVKLQEGLKDAEAAQKSGTGGLGDVGQTITKAFSGVKEAITKPFTDAWDTITGLFGGIGSWFDENVIKPLQEALNPVGEAVNEGVVGGMVDAKKSITTGTQTIGGWIVGGICDVLGIHSPSKVMHDKVGLMIGEGVALGIADSARTAQHAAESLGAGIASSFDVKGPAGASTARAGATVVYNQTINSPDPLTAGQIYRDTRSLLGRREWA